jgi:alkanesulfonate monooxygenase SsuD/methylene tetrahydromethanopterin reductase-like flavin-dependent oxidoreductase (luciferase family)
MMKPWIFEFLAAPFATGEDIAPGSAPAAFESGLRRWRLVEELGFEGIFFSEHHFGLSYSPSPNMLIATVAQRTKRIRLGTMGMVLPFYQPWRVLEEIAMLDHLTGGRLEIGCASGVPQELIQVGVSVDEARERFNEALDILDAGLAAPVISHHGTYWSFENLKILPRPLQRPAPPKWTTVVSTGSARKSAGRGSKICTAFESVGRIAEIFDAYREEADRLGVPAGPEQLGLRRNVAIADTEDAAQEAAARAREGARKVLAGDPRVGTEKSELIDAPKTKAGFSVHDDEFIAGTPKQVAEQIIAQCRATGAGNFLGIFARGYNRDAERMLALFGKEVVPDLRRA